MMWLYRLSCPWKIKPILNSFVGLNQLVTSTSPDQHLVSLWSILLDKITFLPGDGAGLTSVGS